jgi:phenol 2-monooxygenase
VLQGLAKPVILDTYAEERRKIACDLIRFDHEHAKAFIKNDSKALAENFKTNIRFISGVGAVYGPNSLNHPSWTSTRLVPGELLVPARAVRYVDANPVDLQLDIPVLGQWRLYFLAKDYQASKYFLDTMAEFITSPLSILGRASEKSRSAPVPTRAEADDIVQPQRYTTTGRLFTPALITRTPQAELELSDLCSMMRDARWTVYLDRLDGRTSPFRKWVGGDIREGETVLAVVRPDGYVGAIGKWVPEDVEQAAVWVESYFGGFLDG